MRSAKSPKNLIEKIQIQDKKSPNSSGRHKYSGIQSYSKKSNAPSNDQKLQQNISQDFNSNGLHIKYTTSINEQNQQQYPIPSYKSLVKEQSAHNQNMQQKKIQELNNNLSQLSINVSQIKSQYVDLEHSQLKLRSKVKRKSSSISKLDDPKIHSFLSKRQEEQFQRQSRRLQQVQKIQQKRNQQHQNLLKGELQQKTQKMQDARKQTMSIKSRINSTKEQEQAKTKQVKDIMKKYNKQTRLFSIKEKQTQQNQVKRIHQIRSFLQQHSKQYVQKNQKQMGLKQIQQHKKWYQEQRQKLEQARHQEKVKIYQGIQQSNVKFKDLYRGKGNQNLMNELREIQQKRALPGRRRNNIETYRQHIQANHKPKLSQAQAANIKLRVSSSSLDLKAKREHSTSSFREIKRYKYLQGVSYGEVIEEKPLAKSFQDIKKMGNGNFLFMKALPKKKSQSTDSSLEIPVYQPRKQNPLKHHYRKKTSISLTDQPTRAQIDMVLQQLRANDQKISNKQKLIKGYQNMESKAKQIELNDDILLNLERKLNLLHKLEDNKINEVEEETSEN